jgi:hypothetical protein
LNLSERVRKVRRESGSDGPLNPWRKPPVAKVVLFGNSGMARMTYFYLSHNSPHEVAAFTVDRARIAEDTLFGLPILPLEDVQTICPPSAYKMAVPIAFSKVNKLRATA